MATQFTGKIFLTGGTGFLGRGLMRRAKLDNWDCDFTVYSRDEYKQWQCKKRFPEARYILGDIRDGDRLATAMAGHDMVIHTAAVKFIPEAEFNVLETIDVNVQGSRAVFSAAQQAGVDVVIATSTDKAPRPINVYGMTKALMERMLGEFAEYPGDTSYIGVRYGNVIGSTGSVIPLFQEQIAQDNKVKITNGTMTRFWVSVDEAVALLVWAAEFCDSGDIAIPEPKSMTMTELAHCLTNNIEIIGTRPGERMHEVLLAEEESLRTFHMPDGHYILKSVAEAASMDLETKASYPTNPFNINSLTARPYISSDMKNAISDAMYV